ncbi:hypothetical protein Tco_0245891 [Tanacetum coccineum]
MEYDSRVNERLMQTTEEKGDSSKALDASLVIIESNGTESQKQDTSSRSGNDAHVNDADIRPIYNEEPMDDTQQFLQYTDPPPPLRYSRIPYTLIHTWNLLRRSIGERAQHKNGESKRQDTSSRSGNDAHIDDAEIRPIYDEEPMAEVQTTAEINIFATGQQHTEQPEFNNEGKVDQNAEQCHGHTKNIPTLAQQRLKANPQIFQIKWRLLKITLQAPFLNVQMTFEHSSSSLGHQCQMMSDHNSSDLAPQRQMASAENNTSGPVPQCLVLHQITSDHNRSELRILVHINEPSSSKLVPKVVPLAVKTATSRQELELLFHHHIAMLRTTCK